MKKLCIAVTMALLGTTQVQAGNVDNFLDTFEGLRERAVEQGFVAWDADQFTTEELVANERARIDTLCAGLEVDSSMELENSRSGNFESKSIIDDIIQKIKDFFEDFDFQEIIDKIKDIIGSVFGGGADVTVHSIGSCGDFSWDYHLWSVESEGQTRSFVVGR